MKNFAFGFLAVFGGMFTALTVFSWSQAPSEREIFCTEFGKVQYQNTEILKDGWRDKSKRYLEEC